MQIINFFRSPLFIAGLIIRLLLLFLVIPSAASIWYVPFLDVTTGSLTLDPWRLFIESGGSEMAFPYGYVMWLTFSPLFFIAKVIGVNLYLSYGLTLLLVDFTLFYLLDKIYKSNKRVILLAYWFSPIVIFGTYWFGYNDLIPIAILIFALLAIRQRQSVRAGLLCGAAVSAKFSMCLAVPFFCIYLYNNRSLRCYLKSYILAILASLIITSIPILFSSAGLGMLINNPEMSKVYQLALRIGGDSTPIYLLPLAYLLILYLTWRVRRISFQLLTVLLGVSFFLVVMLTPASPGWLMWVVPMFVGFQVGRGKVTMLLTLAFSFLYMFDAIQMAQSSRVLGVGSYQIAEPFVKALGLKSIGILHTIMFAMGMILLVRIWREAVLKDDYFRRSRKPISIGIAGDSGAGKDTLANSIEGLFGKHSVVNLSGDDYHLWDRKKPMWQVMTHLNPKANDLEQYSKDLISLTNGLPIQSRHYDHASGQRSRPHRIESNDVVIASGLHALNQPILRACYDLSIYLDIDEGLRRHFKIERDVKKRGHSLAKVLESIDRREPDSQKFVRPQALHADLVLSLQPIHQSMLGEVDGKHPLRLKMVASSRHGFNEESLVRVLVGVCGLHVDMVVSADGGEVKLSIEGETSSDDIAMAAQVLFPDIHEFLDAKPCWDEGIQGLMQLITLSHISQALKKRLI